MRNARVWIAGLSLTAISSLTGCGSSEMKPTTANGMMGDSMKSESNMMGEEKMGGEKMMGENKMGSGEKMMSGEKK